MTHLSTIGWRLPLAFCFLCSIFIFPFFVHAQEVQSLEDRDADGLPDAWETLVYRTNPLDANTDHEGGLDRAEIQGGWDPLAPGLLKMDGDFDHDRLSDRLELLFGTDPTRPDSDGDGYLDGEEVYAAYSPTSTHPDRLQKSLRIRLKTQRLEQRVNDIALSSFPISSGLPRTPTPVGTFRVLSKSPRAWSASAKLWMPYWMHFSGRGHGIHELPEWPGGRKEGKDHLGRPASHGCVRLGEGPAATVYAWSPIGTSVVVAKD